MGVDTVDSTVSVMIIAALAVQTTALCVVVSALGLFSFSYLFFDRQHNLKCYINRVFSPKGYISLDIHIF